MSDIENPIFSLIQQTFTEYQPSIPNTLVGRWGIFKNNNLVTWKGNNSWLTPARANASLTLFIKSNCIYLHNVYDARTNQYNYTSILIFHQQYQLAIPKISRNFYRDRYLDTEAINQIKSLFQVRQITRDDVTRLFTYLSSESRDQNV